jgi:hypothetical protein
MTLLDDDCDFLIRTAQAALLLGVEPRTLASWRSRHVGPAVVRLSPRVIRYRRGDVLAYIERARRGGAAA